MLTVHLRINDATTRQPTPVRLSLSTADGTPFAPLGRVVEFATGRNEDVGGQLRLGPERWYAIDGSCEIRLPAGVPLRLQARKGPEFRPLDNTLTLSPGQMALRYTIERWSHVAEEQWVAGDSRCHFASPHAALLEAAAEDVAIVNLLACVQPLPSLDGTAYTTAPNLLAFSGQEPALQRHESLVAVNTLNTHPTLGRVALLHSHRPVFPLAFGTLDESDDWSLCDWCDQCHRKNGLTVWVDAFRQENALLGGEALGAAILGKIDALEFDNRPRTQPLLPWVYRLWNAGFPVPLVGGSGKDSNRTPIGGMRTYAQHHGQDSGPYRNWIEGVRAGRTFITNGPMLSFAASGHGPGATLDSPTDDGLLRLVATAKSLHPFEKLEVLADGRSIASDRPILGPGNLYTATIQTLHDPHEGGWLAARCWAAASSYLDPNAPTLAHTSPIWIRSSDKSVPRRATDLGHFRHPLEASRAWVETQGHFTSEKRKQQLLGHHDRALMRLQGDVPHGRL